jgi:hypothetical protein
MLEWASSARPFPGQEVSGDQAIVSPGDAIALIAVIDGLGHGPDAAVAAECAVHTIRTSATADVVSLAQRCHLALAATRGAAMSIASLEGPLLQWLGVGNVEGRIVRAQGAGGESLLLSPGIVGHDLPPLHARTARVARGDLILFATDGVNPEFADEMPTAGSCQTIVDRLLERHARASDDALVLVIRYLGSDS